ncbi:MAG: histidine kinase [Moorea sp. SIO2B7]|nr:histidine kinase [Moorena sp. SIO2B7]
MNRQATPELSLYQLTQSFDPPPQPFTVSPVTLKSLVAAFIDLLIEQQLKTTIWVKSPRSKDYLDEIERYQQQGCADKIYLCSTNKSSTSSSLVQRSQLRRYQSASPIIPIELETNSPLHRDFFLVVLSPQFWGLILAHKQSIKAQVKQSVTNSNLSQMNIICTFEYPVIERVLAGIKQGITMGDSTANELVRNSNFSRPLNSSPDCTLLANLLVKQVQRTDRIQPTETISTQSEQSITDLTQSVRFDDEFISNLVREIRSPLTRMKTALSLLGSKQIKRDQRQRYLKLLHRECERQNSLISGLLELVQLEQISPEESVRLEELVPGIVSTYQPLAEEKGVKLSYTVPSGFPPLSCPTPWLRQIILNLLNNSLKFTPSRGKVSVQASLQNEYIELVISDTGIGIANSELPKIFNNFYRGRTANNEENTGAGLGLSIVQEIVRRCRGSISVSSKVGKGSRFKVLLPVVSTALEEE